MTYTASGATVATNQALADAIRPIIDGHAAWVFIETVLGTGSGASQRKADVYKCLGSLNSIGTDFFAVFAYTGGNTAANGWSVGETYDTTAKTIGKGSVYWGVTNQPATINADGSYGVASAHVANGVTALAATPGFMLSAGGASFSGAAHYANSNWALHVTNDRIIASWQQSAVLYACAYVGAYEPQNTTLDLFPICAVFGAPNTAWQGANNPWGAVNRELNLSSANNFGGLWSVWVDSGEAPLPPSSTAAITLDPVSNSYAMTRVRLASSAGNQSRRGAVRGWLKDCLTTSIGEATELPGDTLSVYPGPVSWVSMSAAPYGLALWVDSTL